MDVHTHSSDLQRVVAYGPHSVVLAHNNHYNNFHSLPPRSLPKATSSYQLIPVVPVAPTTTYVPVQQQKQQQKSQGNHL